ncbi:MAG: hypothetical protein ABL921_33770, partial [Pirellula sp.]
MHFIVTEVKQGISKSKTVGFCSNESDGHKTEKAAQRVFESVERYLTRKLHLVVNHQKSRVCSAKGIEF